MKMVKITSRKQLLSLQLLALLSLALLAPLMRGAMQFSFIRSINEECQRALNTQRETNATECVFEATVIFNRNMSRSSTTAVELQRIFVQEYFEYLASSFPGSRFGALYARNSKRDHSCYSVSPLNEDLDTLLSWYDLEDKSRNDEFSVHILSPLSVKLVKDQIKWSIGDLDKNGKKIIRVAFVIPDALLSPFGSCPLSYRFASTFKSNQFCFLDCVPSFIQMGQSLGRNNIRTFFFIDKPFIKDWASFIGSPNTTSANAGLVTIFDSHTFSDAPYPVKDDATAVTNILSPLDPNHEVRPRHIGSLNISRASKEFFAAVPRLVYWRSKRIDKLSQNSKTRNGNENYSNNSTDQHANATAPTVGELEENNQLNLTVADLEPRINVTAFHVASQVFKCLFSNSLNKTNDPSSVGCLKFFKTMNISIPDLLYVSNRSYSSPKNSRDQNSQTQQTYDMLIPESEKFFRSSKLQMFEPHNLSVVKRNSTKNNSGRPSSSLNKTWVSNDTKLDSVRMNGKIRGLADLNHYLSTERENETGIMSALTLTNDSQIYTVENTSDPQGGQKDFDNQNSFQKRINRNIVVAGAGLAALIGGSMLIYKFYMFSNNHPEEDSSEERAPDSKPNSSTPNCLLPEETI